MSQPTRRAALLTGLASVSLVAFGLAPHAAQAQFMPPALMPGGNAAMPGGLVMPQGTSASPFASRGPGLGMGMPGGMMPSPYSSGGYERRYYNRGFLPRMVMPGGALFPWGPRGRSFQPVPSGSPSLRGESPPAETTSPVSRRGFYEADPDHPTTAPIRSTSHNAAVVPSLPTPPKSRAPVRSYPYGVITTSPPPATNHTTNNDIYAPQTTIVAGGPALLGGYYYGNYCDSSFGPGVYPAVYSVYSGFPPFLYNIGPGTFVAGVPPVAYAADSQPFSPPTYQVTYNQNNYYVGDEAKAGDIEDGGARAKTALHSAYPADSYQAAFADIEQAWTNGNLDLLKKHLHSDDTKVAVYLKTKYNYSLNSSDFAQITRDAFDRLDTVSFQFTRLSKAKNGDVTAYGTHVYRAASDTTAASGGATTDDTVPFDTGSASADGSDDSATDNSPAQGQEKTVYVSYTLRHGDDQWYIVSIDSSTQPLLKDAK